MNKFIKIAAVLILYITAQSCGYGFFNNINFTSLANAEVKCENPPQDVELYFDNEKISFEYEKIGLIEIQGYQLASDEELIKELKTVAKNKCCDAVIFIKSEYVNRERGILFSNQPPEVFISKNYTAIVVRKIKSKREG